MQPFEAIQDLLEVADSCWLVYLFLLAKHIAQLQSIAVLQYNELMVLVKEGINQPDHVGVFAAF